MNWRRGILLSAINLAVAVPMVIIMEARDEKDALSPQEIMSKTIMTDPPKPPEPSTSEPRQASAEDTGQAVSFDMCGMWGHYPAHVVVLQGADMPSLALAGWEQDCPPHWSLAGRLRGKRTWPPTPLWMETQRKIDLGLCLFVVAQWFLIGAFPLSQSKKWWADPGSFITFCTVSAGSIAMFPAIDAIARLPAFAAMLAWYWLIGLLIWRILQFGWKWATGLRVPRSGSISR